MPHFIVEYSANIKDDIAPEVLVDTVHEAVLSAGIFTLAAARTRAVERRHYKIADGDTSHSFVHVKAHIGPGRSKAEKQKAGQHIFDALCHCLQPVFDKKGLGISMEIVDIDNDFAWRQNNLHQRFGSKP